MPKFLGSEDGSDPTRTLKTHTPQNLWVSLAKPADRPGDFVPPMKRSVRPLFSILLLIVFTATVSFRAFIRHAVGSGTIELDLMNVLAHTPVPAPVFNSTLLQYAAVEISEAREKQEIEQLLDGNFGSQGRRQGCFCHPYGVRVPILLYICQPVHILDYNLCNSSHKAPLLVTDPRFDVLCSRIVKYYSLKRFAEETGKSLEEWGAAHDGANFHYSSGMQAVMLALGVCDKVSIFGFGKSTSAKHHYHTNQKEELGIHDYEGEYAFYRDAMEKPWEIPFISGKFKFPPTVLYQ
ncbi:hypothetical protein CJ030_MR1G022630 [Morella rubra]|uniref:Uncharacterized protein n=1 Tax=Morella rubra TaxID=262757 RepID=A0A6A1WX25_9ROSI|nr:hypothetical protein CJ030_MR1G022630 [Morella rubra]